MKRILLIIGLSVISTAAEAACPDDRAAEILGYDAISSHYVQETLDRADNGITYAKSFAGLGSGEATSMYVFSWSTSIMNALYSLVDTNITSVKPARNIEEATSCLHIDLLLLESKIEEVRCELEIAFEEVAFAKMIRLHALMLFLNGRYNALMAGAEDPFFEDAGWSRYFLFDDPTDVVCLISGPITKDPASPYCDYCCHEISATECEEAKGIKFVGEFATKACYDAGGQPPEDTPDPIERFCPFHSNYLPPTVTGYDPLEPSEAPGYGCDREVLSPYSGLDPVSHEYDALEELVDRRTDFIDLAEPTKNQRLELDALMGRPPIDLSNFGAYKDRDHREFFGCVEAFTGDDGPSSGNRGALKLNPIYVSGATISAPRGTFNLEENEIKLMRKLIDQRMAWQEYREVPDYLKNPQERIEKGLPPERDSESAMSIFKRIFRELIRTNLSRWNVKQATREATILAKAQDAPLQIVEMFRPLRLNVKEMVELASQEDIGPRNFSRGLAWYIRRSCIFRPCNDKLETVLKIILEDDCFPYANGKFKNMDAYEKCKEGAEL